MARKGTEFRIANEQQKNQREEQEQHEEQQYQIDLEKKYKFGGKLLTRGERKYAIECLVFLLIPSNQISLEAL